MNRQDLKPHEIELLNKLNSKAMLIIQIEDALREIKLPMDKNVLYELEEEKLADFLEMLSSAKENRKK